MRQTGQRRAAREDGEKPRADLYDEVTRRIIAELEAGRFPWVQPWGRVEDGAGAAPGLPRNALTARAYSGINILILWAAVIDKAYPTQRWLTFRQALDLGGSVRKGERATTVVYADRFIPEDERQRAQRDGDDPHAIPFLKRFSVFNVAQCDGLPESAFPAALPVRAREIVPRAEALGHEDVQGPADHL